MRTLVSYLNERPPKELQIIAEKWEANLSERLVRGQTFELAQEMTNDFLQRRLLEKLSSTELMTLQFFVNYPNYTASTEELMEALGSSPATATQNITSLVQSGLLFYDSSKNPVSKLPKPSPSARFTLSENNNAVKGDLLVCPRELARPLQRLVTEKLQSSSTSKKISYFALPKLLERLPIEPLESQAARWGLVSLVGTTDVQELRKELAQALTEQAGQQRVLSNLDEDSRILFERLKKANTKYNYTIPVLLKDYVSLKRLGRSLRPLTEALLVWEAFEDEQSVVFVPAEIRQPRISSSESMVVPPPFGLQTTVEPLQGVTLTSPYALAWDILTVLNYLGQNEVQLTQQDYIPQRHVKKLQTLLWLPDKTEEPDRFNFLVNLMQRLNLYGENEERRLLPTSHELNAWLKQDFYDQMRQLLKIWQENPQFFHAVYFPYYYGEQYTVQRANRTMLSWLRQCEPGTWYEIESLLKKVQLEDPFFIKGRRELLAQYGLKHTEEIAKHWNKIEAEIIRKTFGSVFEWLGLVRVSRNPLDQVQAFCVTDLGSEVVERPGAEAQSIPISAKPLLIQPNFEIMLLTPHVETLWSLLKFANQKKLDQVSIYTLDRLTVLRGMEFGFTTTAILEWLTEHNPQPLPQNIEISVKDWGKGFKRVTVEQTVLLETEDPQILDELMQSKNYANYFVRRLSPTAAVVRLPETVSASRSHYASPPRVDPLKNFRKLLKAAGFFTR
jgi:DNA-binding MarR family transcriptional regulator